MLKSPQSNWRNDRHDAREKLLLGLRRLDSLVGRVGVKQQPIDGGSSLLLLNRSNQLLSSPQEIKPRHTTPKPVSSNYYQFDKDNLPSTIYTHG